MSLQEGESLARGSIALTYRRIPGILIFLASYQLLRKAIPTEALECSLLPLGGYVKKLWVIAQVSW